MRRIMQRRTDTFWKGVYKTGSSHRNSIACPVFSMSDVLGDGTYELRAHVLAVPPDYFICSTLALGEEQHEFIENLESVDMNSHAFGGNIGNEAIARRNANPELDSSQLPEAVARSAASFLNIERTHNARLQVEAAPRRLATAPSVKMRTKRQLQAS
jgi:hypothetical protein